jgi:hypothetical protein
MEFFRGADLESGTTFDGEPEGRVTRSATGGGQPGVGRADFEEEEFQR